MLFSESEKRKDYYFLYKSTQKEKRFYNWKCHVTMTEKDGYTSKELQLQNHSLTFIHKNNTSILLTTSILSRSPMAHTTTASLDNLTCTDNVDFGKCQERFGQLSCAKNDSNFSDVKLKVFEKDDNQEFRLVQNLTLGEAVFNQFMRLRNQLVIAAENYAR